MAYNNYFPATYQPMYQQPVYQPQIQQNTQPSSLMWVNSYAEAQMYPVAPNNAVALWDSSSPAIYVKQADASGRPTLKVFDIVERSESAPAKDSKGIDYATKGDLAAFSASLEAITKDIETMKGDIYGLAGKRKKKEVTDDE